MGNRQVRLCVCRPRPMSRTAHPNLMDPRLLTIRLILALLASLVLCWWFMPSLWWLWAGLVPVGLFMPVFAADICSACSGTRPDQQLDLSGFTDGTCSTCDTAYNGSFTLAVTGACQ